MDVPPWENVLFLRDAPCRRFINRRSKFSLALSLSFSVSFSSGRREITESLWVSCGCATPRAALRLLISTFRGLNIVRYIFCGLSAEGGGREEICFTPSIFTFVFSSVQSESPTTLPPLLGKETSVRNRSGKGRGIKIMEMGRWSRIRDMEGIVGESSHRWKSRLKYARSQLPWAVDSTQELLRATQRVYTDLVIYRFWPKYAAEIFFTDLFRHEKFRPVASYTFYQFLNSWILEIIHVLSSILLKFEIHFELRGKKIIRVEKRCLLIL